MHGMGGPGLGGPGMGGMGGPPKKIISFNKQPLPSSVCIAVGTDLTPPAPVVMVRKSGQLRAQCVGDALGVALRAWPYVLHSSIDGAMLGTAQSWKTLASLTLCVSLCAVQDVGTIIVSLSASGSSRRATLATNMLFAVGFPFGATLGVAFAAHVAVAPLQAFAAGLFVYMTVFELAPPHAHGRAAALGQLLAFAAGLALVVVSQTVEGWAAGSLLDQDGMSAAANVTDMLQDGS